MDAAAIEKLESLIKRGTPKVIERLPNQTKGEAFVFDMGKMTYETVAVKVDEDQRHEDFQSLIDSTEAGSTFWVSADAAYWSNGFDRGTLQLKISDQMKVLGSLEKTSPDQKQDAVCHTLRTVFRDMTSPENLPEILSAIAWKVNEDGKSVVQQGSRSLGRAIEARIENRDAIPQTVIFTVPVWCTGGLATSTIEAQIVADLMVNPQTQTIRITPVAGSYEKAVQDAVRQLFAIAKGRLSDEVMCYIGRPTELK